MLDDIKNERYEPIDEVIETKKKMGNDDVYKKQCEWKKKIENANKRKREKLEDSQKSEYTFKPDISHLNIQNDENFILKNLAQMNDYVNKRREILKRQKEEEEYKNKRLGQIDMTNNFNIKTTVPREFYFKTDSRIKGKKIYTNVNNKPNLYSNEPYYSLGNNNPKSENYSYANNQINPNQNNENLDLAYNNAYNNDSFVNAINDLKNKIDNLNL